MARRRTAPARDAAHFVRCHRSSRGPSLLRAARRAFGPEDRTRLGLLGGSELLARVRRITIAGVVRAGKQARTGRTGKSTNAAAAFPADHPDAFATPSLEIGTTPEENRRPIPTDHHARGHWIVARTNGWLPDPELVGRMGRVAARIGEDLDVEIRPCDRPDPSALMHAVVHQGASRQWRDVHYVLHLPSTKRAETADCRGFRASPGYATRNERRCDYFLLHARTDAIMPGPLRS